MTDFTYEQITSDQAADVRRQLLEQRLTQLEAEHSAARFAVEQIERQILDAREQLAGAKPE